MSISQEYNQALALERGKGVPKDEPEAARRYKMLAEAGHLKAMDRLGKMYQDGRGVEQNDEAAAELFRKSAEGGDSAGQLDYGWIFAQGCGVDKNDELAFAWYLKSAEQGNSTAQCNVGMRYESGKGVEKNEKLAREWFHRSAVNGNARGRYLLGLSYERIGLVWRAQREFYRAFRKGDELAKEKLGVFLQKLRPENACDIFVSYRRDGGLDFARLIYLELKCRGYNVFFDYNSLRNGMFDEEILGAIQTCKYVVSVVSQGCYDRCAEESDWVRKELAYAFEHGKAVVAVERFGFEVKYPPSLPGDIGQLLSVPRLIWNPDDPAELDAIEQKYFKSCAGDLDETLLAGSVDLSTEGVVGDYTHPDEGFDHCVFRVFTEMVKKELAGGTNNKFQKKRDAMNAREIFGDD